MTARPPPGGPVLSVIDFDAFVARANGQHLALPVGAGGTYGTAGYCPPDLVQKAEAGDLTVAPYSDRHSRDVLLLEFLLAGPDFPPEAPPCEWHPDKLQLRYRALLATAPQELTDAIAHLQPPDVFNFAESQRPSSTDLAKTLVRSRPARPTLMLPGLGMELVAIEPGTFLMGSPEGETGRVASEGPLTQVTITRRYWMGKHQVTQGQYAAVMGSNPSTFKGSMIFPVETVSWADAIDFCANLTEKECRAGRLPAGYVYRLPTEAEWEYACRAGTTSRFSFGDDPQAAELGNYAWYDGNSCGQTQPVGTRPPNPWGLYDLYGHVWEWCLDWSGTYRGGSLADPKGPSAGLSRVIRGGSWSNSANACRSAYRHNLHPASKSDSVGFRVVLALVQA